MPYRYGIGTVEASKGTSEISSSPRGSGRIQVMLFSGKYRFLLKYWMDLAKSFFKQEIRSQAL